MAWKDSPEARVRRALELAAEKEALAARIAADQAALIAPRLAALEAERQRYGLKRRAKLPEEMGL